MSWFTSWLPSFTAEETSNLQHIEAEIKLETKVIQQGEEAMSVSVSENQVAENQLAMPHLQRESYTDPEEQSVDSVPSCQEQRQQEPMLPPVEPFEHETLPLPQSVPEKTVDTSTTTTITTTVIDSKQLSKTTCAESLLLRSISDLIQDVEKDKTGGKDTKDTKETKEGKEGKEEKATQTTNEQQQQHDKTIQRLTRNLEHSRLLYQQLNEKYAAKQAKAEGLRQALEREVMDLRIENKNLRKQVPILQQQPAGKTMRSKKTKKQCKAESKRLREGQSDRFREQSRS